LASSVAPCVAARPKTSSTLIRATVLSPFLAARSISPSRRPRQGRFRQVQQILDAPARLEHAPDGDEVDAGGAQAVKELLDLSHDAGVDELEDTLIPARVADDLRGGRNVTLVVTSGRVRIELPPQPLASSRPRGQ
jgi:hypothetical protein